MFETNWTRLIGTFYGDPQVTERGCTLWVGTKLFKPKEEGGLGIQAARAKNIAFLSKLNWRMYHEHDANWAKVILHKYYLGPRARSSNLDKLPSPLNWKDIKMGFPIFLKGVCWGIGDGSSVRVWSDG